MTMFPSKRGEPLPVLGGCSLHKRTFTSHQGHSELIKTFLEMFINNVRQVRE